MQPTQACTAPWLASRSRLPPSAVAAGTRSRSSEIAYSLDASTRWCWPPKAWRAQVTADCTQHRCSTSQMQAKTGTYIILTDKGEPSDEAQSLAGYIMAKSRRRLAFSLAVNGVGVIDGIDSVIPVFQDQGTTAAIPGSCIDARWASNDVRLDGNLPKRGPGDMVFVPRGTPHGSTGPEAGRQTSLTASSLPADLRSGSGE